MIRKTNTEKWRDAWFTGLKPTEKLVFIFLTENCDSAGFYEVNLNLMCNLIGIELEELRQALGRLKRSFLVANSNEVKKLWLKKYLFHQNCLPLKSENDDHMKIKIMLEQNFYDFGSPEEMHKIIHSIIALPVKKTTTSRKKFVEPTWLDFWEYYQSILDNQETAQQLFDHYLSCGWKVGNKPMVDWKAAIRKNIPNHTKQGDNKTLINKTRKDNVQNASEAFLKEGLDNGTE